MEIMTKEELKKELENLKDFKVYIFEGDVYVKAEDYKKIAIENKKMKEENEKMREELSKKSMENWFDKKANNMFEEEGERYKSQKENILMGKIC